MVKASIERMYSDVKFLTTLKPARNFRNIEGLEKAAGYIEQEFEKTGLQPNLQHWNAQGREYKNIIASYNPERSPILIVGAHYDVYGDLPGADDNASAVAGLLELARLVMVNQPSLNYRIDFVAYCLEEPPFFGTREMGSFVHAQSLAKEKADVLGMICLEMIGYFSEEPYSQGFPSPELSKMYPHTANFIIVVGIERYREFNIKVHQLMKNQSDIDVQIINFPEGDGLAGLSDQRSYWQFNFPALMINDTSFIRNPYYHTSGDTIETLDFQKMSEVVNSAYRAVVNIV